MKNIIYILLLLSTNVFAQIQEAQIRGNGVDSTKRWVLLTETEISSPNYGNAVWEGADSLACAAYISTTGDSLIIITCNGDTLIYEGAGATYTDEQAQDAVGAMIDGSLIYVDATPLLQRAALTGAITAAAGSNATLLGSFTKAQLDGAVSDGNVLYVGDVTTAHVIRDDGSDETQRAALNFVSTSTINMVGTDDAGNNETEIEANIIAGSVGNTELGTGLDATQIADGTVTDAEFQRIGGLTSDAQTQIDGKANRALDNLASVAINTDLLPNTSDATDLGSTTKQWKDLYLGEGQKIDWDNGDATLTQVGNVVTLAGADLVTDNTTVNAALLPDATDGAALGSTGAQFSDLYLAETGTINFDNGDAIIAQSGNSVALTGAGLDLSAATNLLVPTSAAYAPTADGSIGYDNTQEKYVAGGAGGLTGSFIRWVSGGHPAESKTNSTVSEQDYTSIFSIPADYLTENKVLRITLGWQFTSGVSNATITHYLELGGTKVFTQGTPTNITNSITRSATMTFLISGTAASGASVNVETMYGYANFPSNDLTMNATTQPVALATNSILTVVPGIQYSQTGSSETMVLRTFLIEELN